MALYQLCRLWQASKEVQFSLIHTLNLTDRWHGDILHWRNLFFTQDLAIKERAMSESLADIIQRAIGFEEEAFALYSNASGMVKNPAAKTVLDELAAEEVNHKEKLIALLAGDVMESVGRITPQRVTDLKLAEHLVAGSLDESASIQDVLLVAMQREKTSNEFYALMSEISENESAKSLFQFLAAEEMVHKNKVETLYEDIIYREF
jgi:rubrerythrin